MLKELLLAATVGLGTSMAVALPDGGSLKPAFDEGVVLASASVPLDKRAPDSVRLENWAGATLAGEDFTKVSGTVTIPSWRGRENDDWTSGMYMAMRLDGLPGCKKDSPLVSIWHAVTRSQAQEPISQFRANWAWDIYNGGSENPLSFPMAVGDQIRMELEVLPGGTSVNGTVVNLRTGQETYRIMDNGNGVCGSTANWVVGIYSSSGNPKPLTDFLDPVTFSDVSATTGSGEELDLSGAQAMDIEEPWRENPVRGGLQTDCIIVDGSSFTCSRLWPEPPTKA